MLSLLSDEISAFMLPSVRPAVFSAWRGHVAFAHWITQAVRPRITVELGTHNGLSFSAFCNAIKKLRIDGRCFAVDTWAGDEHAGNYSDEVYQELSQFNAKNFQGVGSLLRCYFDEALSRFEDGSIDLLHIDGLHTYEAVRHDFETWLPKLSNRAVVLFHDTEVFDRGFGVWEFFNEVAQRYPSFNFKHGFGLGVLAVGPDVPEAVKALCQTTGIEADGVRERFDAASEQAYQIGMRYAAIGYKQHLAPSARNVALGRPTSVSSTAEALPHRSSVVDGVKDGTFGCHTEAEDYPWLLIDLGQRQPVHKAFVFNRLQPGCLSRAHSLVVHVSSDCREWVEVYAHDGSPFGGADGSPLNVTIDREARFVRLSLGGHGYLHLDQVEVYNHG
jgi:hypothetical protein